MACIIFHDSLESKYFGNIKLGFKVVVVTMWFFVKEVTFIFISFFLARKITYFFLKVGDFSNNKFS